MGDQADKLREMVKNRKDDRKQYVLAISSGKGGVGKTNVAVNLAFVMSGVGKKVMLFDGDLGLANVDVLLGLKSKYSLADVVKKNKKFGEIVIKVRDGFTVVPAGSGIEEMANIDRGTFDALMKELQIVSKDVDILIIDTGAGISRKVIAFLQASENILIVTTPEPTSITDAYAMIKILTLNYGKRNIKFFVNMAKSRDEAVGVYENINRICGKFLNTSVENAGYSLYDKNLPLSVKSQRALVDINPNSSFSISMKELAGFLFDEKIPVSRNPILRFFSSLFGK